MAVVAAVFLLPLVPLLWWRLSLSRDVQQTLSQLEAAGLPVSRAQLNARLPDIALEDNRGTLYYDAQRALHASPREVSQALLFFDGAPLPAPSAVLAPEVLDAMVAAVESNTEALSALHEALNRPAASLLVRYGTDGSEELLTYLPTYTHLVRLLCYESLVAEQGKNWEQAYRSLHAAIALTSSLEHLGYAVSLRFQWEMEGFVIEALARLLHGPAVPEATLAPFAEQFSPAHREEVYRHVLETEQALFVARIRDGRKRTLLKGLVLAAGVGDLNIRAYLAAGDHLLPWPESDFEQRTELERGYAAVKRTWEDSPLLYATVLYYPPPEPTRRIKEELDHAAVVSAALAATRFRWTMGRAPETVAELVPEYLQIVPVSAVTGEPIVLVNDGGKVDVEAGIVRIRPTN